MKSCPKCRQVFSDEYSFCLTDGTPLIGTGEYSEEPTVVTSGRSRGRSTLIFVLAALLAFSLGTTAAVLYFFWPRRTEVGQAPSNTITSNATPVLTPSVSPSPSATARAQKLRRRLRRKRRLNLSTPISRCHPIQAQLESPFGPGESRKLSRIPSVTDDLIFSTPVPAKSCPPG